MRLPPTPCRVCFRPCVFNKFSHFWQKMECGAYPFVGYTVGSFLKKLTFTKMEIAGSLGKASESEKITGLS